MAGKHITPAQKTEALTLRASGNTLTVISDKTGISISTLKRLFTEYGTRKGKLKKEAVQEATNALIHDANAIEQIKQKVSALITDDFALAMRLRNVMAEATEHLSPTNTTEAVQVMRAVSSGAVALKSTSETLRKSLGVDKDGEIDDELPQLEISIMTEQEIEVVKQSARRKVVGIADALDEIVPDDEENEIVILDDKEEEGTLSVAD